MDNLRIWDSLCKTNPTATKPFRRARGFAGTAVKPIWTILRMTEEFGPCGTGWGTTSPTFQVVPAGEETMVYCSAGIWYEIDGKRSETVFGVGGDKVIVKDKNGASSNDEAFKASFTDAISNALKFLGVAADIHMGLFDDEKYVREMKKEFAEDKPPSSRPTASAEQPTGKASPAENEKFERDTVAKIHADIKSAKMSGRIDEILNDPWIDGYLKHARRVAYDGIIAKAEERRTAISLHSTGI